MRLPEGLAESGRDTGPIECVTRHSSPILYPGGCVYTTQPGVGSLAAAHPGTLDMTRPVTCPGSFEPKLSAGMRWSPRSSTGGRRVDLTVTAVDSARIGLNRVFLPFWRG